MEVNLAGLGVRMDEKQGRWTTPKKAEVVLDLLRGESTGAVSRESEVTVETLTRWRDEFIAAGIAGLMGKSLEGFTPLLWRRRTDIRRWNWAKKNQFLRTKGGRSSK